MRYVAFTMIGLLVACGQPRGGTNNSGRPSESDQDEQTTDDDETQTDGDEQPGDQDDPGYCTEADVIGTWNGAFTGTVDTVAGSDFPVQNTTVALTLGCGEHGKIEVGGEVTGMACNGMVCATYSAAVAGEYDETTGSIDAELDGEAMYFGMIPSAFTGNLVGEILPSGEQNPGGYSLSSDSFFGTWTVTGDTILLGGEGAWFTCPEGSESACQGVPADSWSY